MKWLKIGLVVAVVGLVVLVGSCSLFMPPTTYYYIIHSNCSYHGDIGWNTPTSYEYYSSITIAYFVTRAYKFEKGQLVAVAAGITPESSSCWNIPITVTIMKGTTDEGSTGSGGTEVASNRKTGAAYAEYYAD